MAPETHQSVEHTIEMNMNLYVGMNQTLQRMISEMVYALYREEQINRGDTPLNP